jgi:hypothetical protein
VASELDQQKQGLRMKGVSCIPQRMQKKERLETVRTLAGNTYSMSILDIPPRL